ncbi:MAG: mitochondrial fission ELM1 family protein, partial [Alphaproteobacteria bacterium]
RHDRLEGDNVLSTLGALHGVTRAILDAAAARFGESVAHLPRPLVCVLLGGPNGAFGFGRAVAERLGDDLARLAEAQGAGLLITPSRRTPDEVIAVLRARLSEKTTMIWDGSGENPYHGYLGLCDAVIVTEDSVNMVTEASGSGKPIYVAALEGGSAKFARFHEAMRDAGICRKFSGVLEDWHYEPPNDTARAADEVRRRLALATV